MSAPKVTPTMARFVAAWLDDEYHGIYWMAAETLRRDADKIEHESKRVARERLLKAAKDQYIAWEPLTIKAADIADLIEALADQP
jgi:fibrillarin-like rRNA methylase